MTTQVTIEGMFRVASCTKNEYGVSATVVEAGEVDYPQSFMLSLPEGHLWQKGEVARMTLICQPQTINVKASGSRFMKFNVSEYKKVPVRVKYEEVKETTK